MTDKPATKPEYLTGTSLQTMSNHCLRALDYSQAGVMRDERYFAAGTAAHAVLEAFHRWQIKYPGIEMKQPTREEIARKVVLHLSEPHPGYRGKEAPPLPLDRVQEGRDVALIWFNGRPPFKGEPEVKIACDANWKVTADKDAAYRGILDVLDFEEGVEVDPDDGITADVLTIEDYKTAWHTNENECDSRQQRFYALLGLALYPSTTLLIRRIHNLRTGQTFEKALWMDSDSEATVARWRREVEEAREVAAIRGPDGRRPATPGAGCVGCPWVRSCDAAAGILADVDPSTLATRFAVSRALTESLGEQLRETCSEGTIPVPGGSVGYREITRNAFAKDGPLNTVAAWDRANNPELDPADPLWLAGSASTRSLIEVLKPGAKSLKALADRLYPRARGKGAKAAMVAIKEQRANFLATVLTPVKSSAFGVHPHHQPDGNEDRPLTMTERQQEEEEE